jgi:formylglycine-generating enzyme required for sulfatase activity
MDAALNGLADHLSQLSDQFRELREGVRKAVRIADEDPEMALTRARKVLEYVVRDVFERRLNAPPGTRPLEELLQRLGKAGYFPARLDGYAATVRILGNVGTHRFGEMLTAEDVYRSLTQLMPILEWYFAEERPDAGVHLTFPSPAAERISPLPVQTHPKKASTTVVPKGLRSFGAHDSDFFLELLPGPRDKEGLPESLRFWKERIETTDEVTFSVGVIYGPSGCGKSSLVKAGLLPRLADRVHAVYVEATAGETESRLLKGLRKQLSGLPDNFDLAATIVALRQGQGLRPGEKVLIVLDQFEQWLHANRQAEKAELISALRQCDGERVQAIVLVRDDFWVALSRFMDGLQIEMLKGQNTAMVDLFDPRHAKKVLSSFGRAYGNLEESSGKDQEAFLEQAVGSLVQDGRVISVRLALFAEMVKGKPWTPATLVEVGGAEGVGVTFLEETFCAQGADAKHRLHQKAARAVLRALLPEQGADIKGNMRSRQELLDASGYVEGTKDFEDLIRILDDELRLITPTDPEGADWEASQASLAPGQKYSHQKYYQLTHDYLVHSLQQWLSRKQRETLRGRAELSLAYQAALWNAKRLNRSLPPFWDWIKILALTHRKRWSGSQRTMMRVASRHYLALGAAVVVAAMLAGWFGLRTYGRLRGEAVVGALLTADIDDVLDILNTELPPWRRWADPLLAGIVNNPTAHPKERLRASLALVDRDPKQIDYLYERLLGAQPEEAIVIRDRLWKIKADLTERLWSAARQPPGEHDAQCLRAASALAVFDPGSDRWNGVRRRVAELLVSGDAASLGSWMTAFNPVADKLLDPLTAVFRDRRANRTIERSLATSILADYAGKRPNVLADLVQDADEKQFPIVFHQLAAYREQALAAMHATLAVSLESQPTDTAKEEMAKRQANAALVLVRLHQNEDVWPALVRRSDPRARSDLISRARLLDADPRVFVERLAVERDVSVRRALILIIGEFSPDRLTAAERNRLFDPVWDAFVKESDAGVHSAAEWLLARWGKAEEVHTWIRRWADNPKDRMTREQAISSELAGDSRASESLWYVNGQSQTMVVLPARAKFRMGSPPTEAEREGGPEGDAEQLHWETIPRSFAISAKEVTVDQFQRFHPDFDYKKQYAPSPSCPVNALTWYDAVAYCNWLSRKEGLAAKEWCYEPNRDGKYAEGMRMAPDYLKRQGYRLPTEAEWEYACRAGALTSRYYGESDELLSDYAWYLQNSANHLQAVGLLKPNDFGLFDMLGNALEWCQSESAAYRESVDAEDPLELSDKKTRVLRGGSFFTQGLTIRSADRYMYVPTVHPTNVGFRVARTIR